MEWDRPSTNANITSVLGGAVLTTPTSQKSMLRCGIQPAPYFTFGALEAESAAVYIPASLTGKNEVSRVSRLSGRVRVQQRVKAVVRKRTAQSPSNSNIGQAVKVTLSWLFVTQMFPRPSQVR
jgi:hypothetical protein